VLFAFIHLCPLHLTIAIHFTYVFPSLVDDMLIIGFASDVVFIFLMIIVRVFNIRALNVANEVCNLVSTGVGLLYITSSCFFTPNLGFCILGPLVGSKSFVESFVAKAFHEDLGMISSLPMFTNTHVGFVMFLLCSVQCLSYWFPIMFPFPNIL